MTSAADPSPVRFPRSPLRLAAIALVFVAGLALFARHLDFGDRAHPDEPGKVRQVLVGGYNFFHPQLLLRAGEFTSRLAGRPSKRVYKRLSDTEKEAARHRVLIAGRFASAAMAAGAAALLAAGATRRTAFAALATGGAVLLCPTLLVAGHFMKEDTALLLGVAAWTPAAGAFVRRPGRGAAVWLGLAGGLAASGKWIGVVLPLAAVPLVLLLGGGLRRRRAWADAGVALGLTLAVTLLVNHPAFDHPKDLFGGVNTEIEHVNDSHWGIIQNAPQVYLRQLRDDCGAPVLLLAGVEVAAAGWLLVRGRGEGRRRAAARLVAPGVALLFLGLLCTAKIAFPRYGLPVTALLYAVAAAGAVTAGHFVASRAVPPRVAPLVSAAATLLLLAPMAAMRVADARVLLGHFAHDGRDDLLAWAKANLPPGSKVLAERYALLGPAGADAGFEVDVKKRPFYYADAAELARHGYTHVALCDLWHGRYFDPAYAPTPELREDVERMRRRYGELFDGTAGTLLWRYEPESPRAEFVDPALSLYRLTPAR